MTADNLAIGGIAGDHRPPLQGPNSTYELNFRRVLVCDRFSPSPSRRGREARAR